MTTPAEYRALAARVMAGEATNEEVATALEWRIQSDPIDGAYWVSYDTGDWFKTLPLFLTSLDAADALMAPLRERGWEIDVSIRSGRAYAAAWHGNIDLTEIIDGAAPDECAARVAMALLCLAAEGEATP